MFQRTILSSILGCAILIAQPAHAYEMVSSTFGSGGSLTSSASFQMESTLGQAAVGVVTGPDHTIEQGFWYTLTGDEASTIPTDPTETIESLVFSLSQNQPNPFGITTSIRYSLPSSMRIRLEVIDASGRRVQTLVDGELPAGVHVTTWDGNDTRGRSVGSGVYTAKLVGAGESRTTKMILMH